MSNIFVTVKEEIREWFECLCIRNVPGGLGIHLRRFYWGRWLKGASTFFLYPGCIITAPERISLGNEVIISRNCSLFAHDNGTIKIGGGAHINSGVILSAANGGEIVLGENVIIGPNAVMRASSHLYSKRDIPIKEQSYLNGKIVVEEDVWIGANVVILPNIRIGKGSVIGAGAVVNSDIPPYSLAGGVPARVIKESCRF